MSENTLHIYTDGACEGNPGPGAWSSVMLFNGSRKEMTGYAPYTTNNKMELSAPLAALRSLKETSRPYSINVYSDSQYLIKGMNEWLAKWKKNGWRSKSGQVKNKELWEALDKMNRIHEIKWIWVKGHASSEHNNRCDFLAKEQIRINRG